MVRFKILVTLSVLALLIGVASAENITVIQNAVGNVLNLAHNLIVSSPMEVAIYTNRMILVNVTAGVDKAQYIKYKDNDKSPEVILCRNCNSVSKRKSFDEGFHNVLFSAVFPGEVVQKNVVFWVDSRAPVVKKTFPTGGFGLGDFTVNFYESNPKYVALTYGNNESGYRTADVNLSQCSVKRDTWTCTSYVDLGDYDGENVKYWFDVTDLALHSDSSKVKTVAVDFSSPVITNLSYFIDGRRVSFVIDIEEINFKSASYKDLLAEKPKEVVLCRKLKDGQCRAEKRFTRGEHDLLITIEDEAGNKFLMNLEFEID